MFATASAASVSMGTVAAPAPNVGGTRSTTAPKRAMMPFVEALVRHCAGDHPDVFSTFELPPLGPKCLHDFLTHRFVRG